MAWEPAANSRNRQRRLGFAWLTGNCILPELSSFIGDRDRTERTSEDWELLCAADSTRQTLHDRIVERNQSSVLVKGSLINKSPSFHIDCGVRCSFSENTKHDKCFITRSKNNIERELRLYNNRAYKSVSVSRSFFDIKFFFFDTREITIN